MTAAAIAHLLDDFALGGVTRGLAIFDAPEMRAEFASRVLPIGADTMLAPPCNAAIIVTHLPPNWRRLVLLATLRLRHPRARLVHVEHSYSAEWAALHVAVPCRFAAMLRLAFAMVDTLVCVSAAQRQWLIDLGVVAPEKAVVITPVSPDGGRSAVSLPQFAPGQPLTIGAYGRFHDAKGFDRLIAAMAALPGTCPHRLLIGGYGNQEAALRRAASGQERIQFCGAIQDVTAFLAQCDIIAVPSRYETFGQVAQEAREAGRPILVSNVGGLPEQAGGAGLVVDFDRPDAVADLLMHLDPLVLAHMAAAARAATANVYAQRISDWLRLLRAECPELRPRAGQCRPRWRQAR
jgi:glycosyltransferase involved in cell wall biosynthesis